MHHPAGATLYTSDRAINRGFDWASRQAAQYVHRDRPAGPCYEAALPGREAFCMRDVSHQALGAQVLGAGDCTRSMLQHFARNISEAKRFCSYWEICFDGAPCPVDYAGDGDFWYNLPANFDVMDTAMRMYDWTGDLSYLHDPQMEDFHRMSMDDYIRRWDRDHDGIPDRRVEEGRRGIASYDETDLGQVYSTAADLVAAQYAATAARARMLALRGEQAAATAMAARAAELRRRFHDHWWNEPEQRYESYLLQDGTYGGAYVGVNAISPLYYGIIDDPARQRAVVKAVAAHDSALCVEERSYVPEVLWRYGEHEAALAVWLRMTHRDYARREYPEISYAALGGMASGYMGISPDASKRAVRTRSAILGDGWAEMCHLPLWGGEIHVLHEGRKATTLENVTGGPLTWVCCLDGGRESVQTIPAGETVRVSL